MKGELLTTIRNPNLASRHKLTLLCLCFRRFFGVSLYPLGVRIEASSIIVCIGSRNIVYKGRGYCNGQSAVELSLLRLALGVKRKTGGVGPRRRGETSTGSSSEAHLGPFASFLAVEVASF
jgi:hypothetical protein